MNGHALRSLAFVLLLVLSPGRAEAGKESSSADLLWDRWGVPHVFASDEPQLFHAFGWAQAHSHGDLLLRLYGQARARAAEYWGADELESDLWLLRNGVPERAQRWLEQQSPAFRRNLEAFAAGINGYAAAHPQHIDPALRIVLPVSAVDVLAHLQRLIHFSFVTDPGRALGETGGAEAAMEQRGSNAWAVGPARAAGGRAMLLANPHLPWSERYRFYEAQLQAPGVDVYGVTLVGLPVLVIGFNDALGWTHTVNPLDAADVYALTPTGEGYRWDGAARPYEQETRELKVRQPDGRLVTQSLTIRRSVHGPVIREDAGGSYALRVAGLDRPAIAEQWWAMARARKLGEFQSALRRMQLPMFNVLYADRDGHILYRYNGQLPRRSGGSWADWRRPQPGERPERLWSAVHDYDELPQLLDPPSHWLHNANDPPWSASAPPLQDADAFPQYFAPRGMSLRAQRSARLIAEDPRVSFAELLQYKHSTRMELADRVLDPLLAQAPQGSAAAREAAAVLRRWDRRTQADSRGALLFMAWAEDMGFLDGDETLYAQPWNPQQPWTTPAGLADPARAVAVLETAAQRVRERDGALDRPWGEVVRLRQGRYDLPANGGPGGLGIYRVLNLEAGADGCLEAVQGDSFVAAIEFQDPPRARALLAYGNATQPGSPHVGDQLPLFARQALRPVWRTRRELAGQLARRERLTYRAPATDEALLP